MKTLVSALVALVLCHSAFAGRWLAEDTIGKEYWSSLGEKSKIVFLTGYRSGQGPRLDDAAPLEFRVLRTDHFPALAKKLNAFSAAAANEKSSLVARPPSRSWMCLARPKPRSTSSSGAAAPRCTDGDD
jgi:hypothetical protein